MLVGFYLKEVMFIASLAVVKSLASILNLTYKDKNIRKYRYFIAYLENYFKKYIYFFTNNSAKVKKEIFYLKTTLLLL